MTFYRPIMQINQPVKLPYNEAYMRDSYVKDVRYNILALCYRKPIFVRM